MNDMHHDDDATGIVAQHVANHPIVPDAQFPQPRQLLPIGDQPLFRIIELGQTGERLGDAQLDCVVEPSELVAGGSVPLNPRRQYATPSPP